GVISLSTAANPAQVNVIIKKTDWNEKHCVSNVHMSEGGDLAVTVKNSSWFTLTTCAADVFISMPEGIDVAMKGQSGPIRARGVFGHTEFVSPSGHTDLEGSFASINGKAGTGQAFLKGN